MHAGMPAFAAATVTDVLAGVIEHEPDWSGPPATVPATAHRVLRRSLHKYAAKRLRGIGDARSELEDAPDAARDTPPTRAGLRGGSEGSEPVSSRLPSRWTYRRD
jgi:hypothetical protein